MSCNKPPKTYPEQLAILKVRGLVVPDEPRALHCLPHHKRIANTYSLSADNLKSILEHCVYVRNLCAHHARLWNRKFTVTVQLPQNSPASVVPNLNRAEDRRLYNALVLLTHIVGVIEPAAHWSRHLTEHLLTLKPDLLPHMGFPTDWQQRPLWQQLLAAK